MAKDADHMRSHRFAKPSGQASEVVDGFVLDWKKRRHPVVHANQQGIRSRRQPARERGLPSSDLAAEKVQGRSRRFHRLRLAPGSAASTSTSDPGTKFISLTNKKRRHQWSMPISKVSGLDARFRATVLFAV